MIRIRFNPDELKGDKKTWWDAWASRASKKMTTYLEKRDANEECELDSGVWSDLKAWLLPNLFHNKCAYCEAKVTGTSFGDGEHYRPKGNVTIWKDGTKHPAAAAHGQAHGGYYWLAYDWQNLVPACTRCNNSKSDLFEVATQHDATLGKCTKDLNAGEVPLLLYPYEDEPSDYMRFGKAGVVAAINGNRRGTATIRILGLNRQDLMDERWHHQSAAIEALAGTVGQMLSDEDASAARFDKYMGAPAPFSRAVFDWFSERMRIATARAAAAAVRAQVAE